MNCEISHGSCETVAADCPTFMAMGGLAFILFCIDPPYWGKGMFGRNQFMLMAASLANIKDRFLLSLNNRPEVREVFKRIEFEEVKLTYSVTDGKGKSAREMMISSR